jgi:hypothetical protein
MSTLIRHPRGKLAVAALAIGFWSQVYLWHGWLHGDVDQQNLSLVLAVAPPALPPVPGPPPPPPFQCRKGAPRIIEDLHNPGASPIGWPVRAAAAEIEDHEDDIPRSGRLWVRVAVGATGRVSRVTINTETAQLSRAGHRVIVRALKRQRFPRSTEAYVTEFPLNFKSG